jgi:hypothetical protein
LLPYLIWKRQINALLGAFISIAFGLATPALIWGWERNRELVQHWFRAMSEHNMSLQTSPNTIYGLINQICLNNQAGSWLIAAVLLIICIGVVFLIMHNDKRESTVWSDNVRYSEYFLLVALVPNLVHTDTEHFMWVWPMLALGIQFTLHSSQKYRRAATIALIVAFVPFAINSPDIVGKKIQHLFDEGGLGLANLLIITVAVFAASRKLQIEQPN